MNRRTFIRNGLIGAAGIAALSGGGIFYYINRPEFGRLPRGDRLQKILNSPHYFTDHFECLTPVQVMSENSEDSENRVIATLKFVFGDKTNLIPPRQNKFKRIAAEFRLCSLDGAFNDLLAT